MDKGNGCEAGSRTLRIRSQAGSVKIKTSAGNDFVVVHMILPGLRGRPVATLLPATSRDGGLLRSTGWVDTGCPVETLAELAWRLHGRNTGAWEVEALWH